MRARVRCSIAVRAPDGAALAGQPPSRPRRLISRSRRGASSSSALTGNGSAIGSVARRLRPCVVEPIEPEVRDVDQVGRAAEREVGRDARDARAPHHPVTARRGDRHALDPRRRPASAPGRGSAGGRACSRSSPPRSCGARGRASTGTSRASRVADRSYAGQSIDRASPGGSSGSLQPNSRPPSSSRQYRPSPMSKTIGIRSTSNASCGSSTATVWRAAPAGMRSPASRPTARSDGPPVRRTRSVSIGPADVSTPTTRGPPSRSARCAGR